MVYSTMCAFDSHHSSQLHSPVLLFYRLTVLPSSPHFPQVFAEFRSDLSPDILSLGIAHLLLAVILPLGYSFATYFPADPFSVALPAIITALAGGGLIAARAVQRSREDKTAVGSAASFGELLVMPILSLVTAAVATAHPSPAVLWIMPIGRMVLGALVDCGGTAAYIDDEGGGRRNIRSDSARQEADDYGRTLGRREIERREFEPNPLEAATSHAHVAGAGGGLEAEEKVAADAAAAAAKAAADKEAREQAEAKNKADREAAEEKAAAAEKAAAEMAARKEAAERAAAGGSGDGGETLSQKSGGTT